MTLVMYMNLTLSVTGIGITFLTLNLVEILFGILTNVFGMPSFFVKWAAKITNIAVAWGIYTASISVSVPLVDIPLNQTIP